jgi:hypothetical protein
VTFPCSWAEEGGFRSCWSHLQPQQVGAGAFWGWLRRRENEGGWGSGVYGREVGSLGRIRM